MDSKLHMNLSHLNHEFIDVENNDKYSELYKLVRKTRSSKK